MLSSLRNMIEMKDQELANTLLKVREDMHVIADLRLRTPAFEDHLKEEKQEIRGLNEEVSLKNELPHDMNQYLDNLQASAEATIDGLQADLEILKRKE